MKYSDEQRIKKIYENASKLNEYIKSNKVTKDRLMDDYTLQWLVTTPLYNIGEHAYKRKHSKYLDRIYLSVFLCGNMYYIWKVLTIKSDQGYVWKRNHIWF